MRILLVSRDLRHKGGVANFAKLLLKHSKYLDAEIIHFVEGKIPDKSSISLPAIILTQYHNFIKILKTKEIDIVHLNPSMGRVPMWRDGLYLRIAKKMGTKVLFFIRGWEDSYFKNAVKKGPFKNFHQKSLQMADKIIVLSKEFKDELISIGIEKNKIYTLTTMVESLKFKPKTEKTFYPPYRLLFCGNIKGEKGVFESLKAFSYVQKIFPDITLTFLGDGNDMNNLKTLARKLNIQKNVQFMGYVTGDEKYEIFKRSHIFVFPSYTEGFPNVILEAMAAGNVIITTPVGGLKYEFEDGKNGYLIHSMPPDPREIADKIIYLLKSPKTMKEISSYNLKQAAIKYDVKVVLKKLMRIYEDMVNS